MTEKQKELFDRPNRPRIIQLITEAHAHQTYGPKDKPLPYTYHLLMAEKIGIEFGITDHAILDAILMHDLDEDTKIKVAEIERLFGYERSQLVYSVTDENYPDGRRPNRSERHRLTYPKILRFAPKSLDIKLADMLANVRNAKETKNGLFGMYRKEYPHFKETFFKTEILSPQGTAMFAELDIHLS